MKILENNPQLTSQERHFTLTEFFQIESGHHSFPAGNMQVAIDDFEQAALATACLPDKEDKFALVDGQVYVSEDEMLGLVDINIFECDYRVADHIAIVLIF